MVVLAKRTITEFITINPKSADAILRWYLLTKASSWANFAELKKVFPATDAVGDDLYIFNVGGNKYRIIVRIIFPVRTVYIRFIGTHDQYNKVTLSDL